MLSYQHGYHAGNHGDIIKHLCWLAVLRQLSIKQKPFSVFDTHGGAGLYSLRSEQALKTNESAQGIERIRNANSTNALVKDYLALVAPYLAQDQYTGSPVITANALRDNDQFHVMELHPTEAQQLQYHMKHSVGRGNVHVHHRDGLEGVIALSPPKPNRGAVLIDPPYEQLSEYTDVVNTIKTVLKRWPQAQIVVWYPLLSSRAEAKSGASEKMLSDISALDTPLFDLQLIVAQDQADVGMYGSGVCVINPSWKLDETVSEAIKSLCPVLGESVTSALRWLNPPT